jgi:hypothetical protein
LWSFCGSSRSGWERAALTLESLREQGGDEPTGGPPVKRGCGIATPSRPLASPKGSIQAAFPALPHRVRASEPIPTCSWANRSCAAPRRAETLFRFLTGIASVTPRLLVSATGSAPAGGMAAALTVATSRLLARRPLKKCGL